MKAREILVELIKKQFPDNIIHLIKRKDLDITLLALKEMVLSKKKSVDYRIGEPDLSQNEAFNEAIDSVAGLFEEGVG